MKSATGDGQCPRNNGGAHSWVRKNNLPGNKKYQCSLCGRTR